MPTHTFRFRLPPKECLPNARPNRYAKARQIKLYRTMAHVTVLDEMPTWMRKAIPFGKAAVTIRYFTAGPRLDKIDNLVAWAKPLFDGIEDAGVVENDSNLELWGSPACSWTKDTEDPRVEIDITPIE